MRWLGEAYPVLDHMGGIDETLIHTRRVRSGD